MKQDDVLSVSITALGNDAMGIAKAEEWTVFTPYVCVGEKAEVKITFANQRKRIAYAKLCSVSKPSEDRVKPPCKYFGECGGCALQHMSYEAQLQQKAVWVKNNFRKLGGIEIELPEVVSSEKQYFYRNKVSMPAANGKNGLYLGLYKRDTHSVVKTDKCLLCDDWAEKLVKIVTRYFNENNLYACDTDKKSGAVKHVVCRYVDGQLLVTVVTNGEQKIKYEKLISALSMEFSQFGLYENANTLYNNVILDGESRHIYGIQNIMSTFDGVSFQLAPDSFFQVNDNVKDKLYARVKETIESLHTDVLIDCFSGVGLLSAMLYSPKYDTYAIEMVKSAVENANELKKNNNLERLNNICGDVNEVLPELMQSFDSVKMHLNNAPFAKIKEGSKTVELRLNDEKRKKLKVGNTIEFENTLTKDKLYATVESLAVYENFEALYLHYDYKSLGCDKKTTVKEFAENIPYYSKEQVQQYGALAIGLKDVTEVVAKKTVTVVFDPPRKGLTEEIIKTAAQSGIENVVYVSCDSATLARDVKSFLSQGYELKRNIECFDMFPQTTAVETLICLTKKS